jgi:phosphoribosylanthranilate isomerase
MSEAKCDPGEGESPRTHIYPHLPRQPLTPTLSPQERGEGAESRRGYPYYYALFFWNWPVAR